MKDDVRKHSYLWNTISGVINAGQSAVILIIISRVYSQAEAGVFSIAYAIALLGMTLAKYGQRNYQVTDVRGNYSFAEYRNSRWISISITMIMITCYLLFQWGVGSYDFEKLLIVFLLCIWKQIDAIEDVYYGMYQQKGRLDIGAKRYSERLIFSTILFSILLMLNIRFSIVVLVVMALSCVMSYILIQKDKTDLLNNDDYKYCLENVKHLLMICLTLCLSSTLAVYIGNIPKYFIDIYWEDSIQAEFGYLIMPAFVIMVLSMVVFQPIIREMGEAVNECNYSRLSCYVVRQIIYIALITSLILLVGGVIGIPVLNLLYHIDLMPYWWEFMILLLGGGFYALSQFLIVPIISLRRQNDIAVIYIIVTIISIILGRFFVSRYMLKGASILYLAINIILSLILVLDYLIRVKIVTKNNSKKL